VAECGEFAQRTLGVPRVKVSDTSVMTLWQQVTDFEELPGVRLTFTTAANTPDAIAFLAGRAVAERLVFHAPCGRLHVWPAEDEARALVADLAGRGFTLIGSRGLEDITPAPVARLRESLRRALDPSSVFALPG
jgi:hypothetical protein